METSDKINVIGYCITNSTAASLSNGKKQEFNSPKSFIFAKYLLNKISNSFVGQIGANYHSQTEYSL